MDSLAAINTEQISAIKAHCGSFDIRLSACWGLLASTGQTEWPVCAKRELDLMNHESAMSQDNVAVAKLNACWYLDRVCNALENSEKVRAAFGLKC